jgi:hypothetical protein
VQNFFEFIKNEPRFSKLSCGELLFRDTQPRRKEKESCYYWMQRAGIKVSFMNFHI